MMNFERKHIIVVVITLCAMYMLWRWDRQTEAFTAVQHYPYLSPENWNKFKAESWPPYNYHESEYKTPQFVSKWNPLWDSDDAYHPIVPKVTRYNSPNIEVSEPKDEPVEEQPMIEDVEPEVVSMPESLPVQLQEQILGYSLVDMETMIMLIVFVGVIWYFSRQ